MRRNRRIFRSRAGGVAVVIVLSASSLVSCGPTASSPVPVPACTTACELGQLGRDRGITIGAAVTADGLRDPAYAAAVLQNFNAVTTEIDMKWRVVHPTSDSWVWAGADAVVDFASRHSLPVRGHTLVWGKESANPSWLVGTTSPAAFRSAVLSAITTEVGRYAGRVQRWDVVNEPFTSDGNELDHNVFYQRMGPDYIEQALRTAHAADPSAGLWINESGLELGTSRADNFIAMAAALVARGVPLQGIGIQAHRLTSSVIQPGRLASVVRRLRALGLQVAITELDVPTGPTRSESDQVDVDRQIAGECLDGGCTEITTWGVSDGATWLDQPANRADLPALEAFPVPTRPLLLDTAYRPKAAYRAVADVLRAH